MADLILVYVPEATEAVLNGCRCSTATKRCRRFRSSQTPKRSTEFNSFLLARRIAFKTQQIEIYKSQQASTGSSNRLNSKSLAPIAKEIDFFQNFWQYLHQVPAIVPVLMNPIW